MINYVVARKNMQKSIVKLGIVLLAYYYETALANSAWMPEPQKYKIYFTLNVTDSISNRQKEHRVTEFTKIQSAIHKLQNSKYHGPIGSKEFYIKQLQKEAIKLKSYQDDVLYSINFEEGVKDHHSLGFYAEYKENIFSKYNKSQNKLAKIFYKYKLFQKESFISAIQTKIIFDNTIKNDTELYNETSLLFGMSKEYKKVQHFTEFDFSKSFFNSTHSDSYYSLAISEGIKFLNGFMVLAYTKYRSTKTYNPVYSKTLYSQFSIAKEFNFGSLNAHHFTFQVGYFCDQSLRVKNYKLTGPIFSIWMST